MRRLGVGIISTKPETAESRWLATFTASIRLEVQPPENAVRLVRGTDEGVLLLAEDALVRADIAEIVHQVRLANPAIPILGFAAGSALSPAKLAALTLSGLDDLHFHLGTPHQEPELLALVQRWRRHRLPSSVVSTFESAVACSAQPMAGWSVRSAFRRHSRDRVARQFNVHRRSLERSLRRSGGPTLGELLAFARLVHVAIHLDRSLVTEAMLAHVLGFASDGALRMLVRRKLGTNISALRGRAVHSVLRAWALVAERRD